MSDPAPQSVPPRVRPTRSGSATRKRTRLVVFRATEEECATIATAAEVTGLTVGSYIRTRLLTAPQTRTVRRPPVEKTLLAQLLGQLGKVGGNLHQLLRRVNFGDSPAQQELESAAVAFRETADAILQALGRPRPRAGARGTP